MTQPELDTDFTDEIVCPWCGYEHRDKWEYQEGEQFCGDCGRKFFLGIHTKVTYSTERLE
ncbi:hypothetical protein Plim_4285 (plasmid) [Planctopirus limnophila DSM 3776]|uniref:Uncharacterized protein n=1 Tax=Planctopirus limnophila (strain ATCC 43296 / DSM 3776 / IFAM 1008 / Mu 290) TaxID=521674 RepID=D5SZH2_PLAL2|nr:hypothetical protein Plim_4285 [Planctopirus limnophila DSM 3776]